MKTGYILETYSPLKWYKPMSWLSNLIRFFCKTKYSHTGIIINDWGVPFINEALANGVMASPLTKYIGHHVRISELIQVPEPQEETLARKANSKIGITPYDFSGLLFWQLLYQLTGHWFGSTDKDRADDKFFCYEYVGWVHSEFFPDWYKLEPKQMETCNRRTIFEGIFKG